MPRTIGELAVKVLDDVIAHYRRRRCSDKRHPAQQRSTLRTLLRPAASAATGPRMCVLVAGRHRDSRAVTICLRAAYAVTLRASCPFPARRLLLFPNSSGVEEESSQNETGASFFSSAVYSWSTKLSGAGQFVGGCVCMCTYISAVSCVCIHTTAHLGVTCPRESSQTEHLISADVALTERHH